MEPTTLCIELNKGDFLDSQVIRLQKGWTLRFRRGDGLLGTSIHLRICDTPTTFTFKELQQLSSLDADDVQEYQCDTFGAFKYEFFLGSSSPDTPPIGHGFFSVVPEWRISNSNAVLSLNGLSVITHLSKLLGPLSEWEDRLRVAHEAGYNVIHLTPVQTLGISNSGYSIADYHSLNPAFKADFPALQQLVEKMEREWHVLTIQDVVWNHAAKNSRWLQEHPESTFNCRNSPHLRPAYIVDRALQQLSREIGEGKWVSVGVPATIDSPHHIEALRQLLAGNLFPSLKLHEFFQVDVDKWVEEFRERIKAAGGPTESTEEHLSSFVADPQFHRFGATIDLHSTLKAFNRPKEGAGSEEERVGWCVEEFKARLLELNQQGVATAQQHIDTAINATLGHVHYERVDGNGPRRGAITHEKPLVTNYFLHPTTNGISGWQEEEKLAYDPSTAQYLMACNGWIMNADPLVNFAEAPSTVYLRRELVCWGDCVKLNYGQKPEDSPFLWDYMQKYAEQCASIFHGFRIDNCHSTPMHVAEYLLRAARRVRKDLYVVAELFTGSEVLDNRFVNHLGITSLIRECQNAPDPHEQGRLVYRYGGDPVGAFRCKSVRPAPPSVAHALFCDETHDNPSPFQKRTAYDYVPTAAMTAMAYCASGSTRGYDEYIPFNIDVVKETRLYHSWSEIMAEEKRLIGMLKARRLFNDLHAQLAATGYSEIFVDQVNEDIVAITRHNPLTHESVLLISHCCFSTFKWTPQCRPVHVADDIAAILFEVKTVEGAVGTNRVQVNGVGEGENERLEGLPNFSVEIYENVPLNKSSAVDIIDGSIHFKLFLSGSVIAFK